MSTTKADLLVTYVDEPDDMKCPVCGVAAVDEEGPCDLPSCPHLSFVFVNGEAFEFAEDGLEEWLQQKEDIADEDEDLDEYDVWEALKEYLLQTGKIVERVDHEMSCGPVSLRIWAGFRTDKQHS